MMRIGSPTDVLWSSLLVSDELDHYLEENRRRLAQSYKFLTTWLQAQAIAFRESNAGHFLLADLSNVIRKRVKARDPATQEITAHHEVELTNDLVDGGVFINPGERHDSFQFHAERTR